VFAFIFVISLVALYMIVKMTGQPRLDARHFFALSIAALALSFTLMMEPAGEACQETVKTDATGTTTYRTCQAQYQPSPFFVPTLLLAFAVLIISVVELTGEGFKVLWD
jgi:hypothetical protein